MAINKKLIHFKKKEDFNQKKLSTNEANTQYRLGVNGTTTSGTPDIKYQSIVFIKDTKEIWTHDQIYPCPYTEEEIVTMIKDATVLTKSGIESVLTGNITSHTHNYAGSTSAGGAANSVKNALIVQVNSGTSEGTNKYSYNGSTGKTLNFKAGNNVTLSASSGTITINSTASGGSTFPLPYNPDSILVSKKSTTDTQSSDISTQASGGEISSSPLDTEWISFRTQLQKYTECIPRPTKTGQELTTVVNPNTGSIMPVWKDSYDDNSYGFNYVSLDASISRYNVGTQQILNEMPVQSGMKGCVYNPKTKKLQYWLDPDNWNYIDGITQEMSVVLYPDSSGLLQLPVYRNAGYWECMHSEDTIESEGIKFCNANGEIIDTDTKFRSGVDFDNKTYYVRILLNSTNPGLSLLKQRITKQPERLQISMYDVSDLQQGTPMLTDLSQLVWKDNDSYDNRGGNGETTKGVVIQSASFATTSEGQILIVEMMDTYLTEEMGLEDAERLLAEHFNCDYEEYQIAVIRLKSDLSGYDGEVMVWIPPFQLRNEPGQIRIKEASATKYDQYDQIKGFLISAYPLSIVRSNPNDGGYLSTIGTYPCLASVCNDKAYCRGGNDDSSMDQWLTKSSNNYSMTQFTQLRKPITAINRTQARNWCKYSNTELIDFEHVMLINILAMIENKLNIYKRQSGFVFNGATPKYLIGEMNNVGNNTSVKNMTVFKNTTTPSDITSSNVSSKVCTDVIYKYRGIENFWGDSLTITDKVIASGQTSNRVVLYYNPKSTSYDTPTNYSNNIAYITPSGTTYKFKYSDFKQLDGSNHSLFPSDTYSTTVDYKVEWASGTNNVTVGYCNGVNDKVLDIRCADAVTGAPSNVNFTSVYRSMVILDKEPSL